MSSTTVVTQKYRCSRLCSLHKRGNILLPSSMGFSQQKEDIFEPISALPWTFFKPVKIFKESVIPRWGRVDFSNNPRFPHGGGHQVVVAESAQWIDLGGFLWLMRSGLPMLWLFFWKKVVKMLRWKTQPCQFMIRYRKQGICFFPPVSDFFFVNERIVVKTFLFEFCFFWPFFCREFWGCGQTPRL